MKTLHWVVLLAFLLPLVSIGAYFFGNYIAASKPPPVAFSSLGMTIREVRELSELTTLRLEVADVLTGERPSARIAVLVKGDADLSVDLSQGQFTLRDEQTRKATLSLPRPRVNRPRIDHQRTKVYKIEKTSWLPWQDERDVLYTETMGEAQKLVEFAVSKEEHRIHAQACAERVLTSYYRACGWTVSIEWR